MTTSGGVPRDAPTTAFEIELAAVLWDMAKVWANDVAGGDLSNFVRATLSPRVAAAIDAATGGTPSRVHALAALRGLTGAAHTDFILEHPFTERSTLDDEQKPPVRAGASGSVSSGAGESAREPARLVHPRVSGDAGGGEQK